MKRRTLFGKLTAIAAVVAVGPAVKVVEAAPAAAAPESLTGPEWWAREHDRMAKLITQGFSEPDYVSPEIIVGRAFGQDVWARNPRYLERLHEVHTDGGMTWTSPSGLLSVYTPPARTFEAMQAACTARGCSLDRQTCTDSEGAWVNYYHRPLPDSWQDDPDDPSHLARVDAWRLSLHGEG